MNFGTYLFKNKWLWTFQYMCTVTKWHTVKDVTVQYITAFGTHLI